MTDAREAVARAISEVVLDRETKNWDLWTPEADAALAVLRPIIAAEIRAWAETERRACPDYDFGGRETADNLTADADYIASRICGGDR